MTRDEQPISLTPLEFDLLVALARKPWQVFTREVLLEQVWGYRHAADTRLVNVHVQRLRSKIEQDPERPEIVVTVRGVGYKAGQPAALVTSTVLASSTFGDRAWAWAYGVRSRSRQSTAFLTRGWHRSLTLRVVLTTLVLSATVVGLLGWVLLGRVTTGLLEAKERSALDEARAGVSDAQGKVDAVDRTDPASTRTLLSGIVSQINYRAGNPARYSVVLLGSQGEPGANISEFASQLARPCQRPGPLRTAVEGGQTQWYTYTSIRYTDGTAGGGRLRRRARRCRSPAQGATSSTTSSR